MSKQEELMSFVISLTEEQVQKIIAQLPLLEAVARGEVEWVLEAG